ncbi:MAG: hypothetical protein SPJ78_06775 [Corynebacterium camporealensis]|uniref:hypothetical protein n=1 Tax=Corynebacterium camporealensis TaxID=161896 RepID=UPI002A912577|nr:hypothetical protein [Corynebacterium camporealensis]MDY5840402.1 hypothetical protein [Corynebacterium camporealensis]
MTKAARNFVALVIAAFAVVMMVLVASSMMREDNNLEGNLSNTLESAPGNLDNMILVPMDVYGPDYQAIGFVCPGTTEEDLSASALNPEEFSLENGAVPEGDSYAIAFGPTTGSLYVEELNPNEVEVCEMIGLQMQFMEQQGQDTTGVPMLQGNQPLTFQRGEHNTWKLVG